MQPELICCNFREQAGSRLTFFNRLAGLLGGKHLPAALFARVFKYDVMDVFEERLNKFQLVRDIKAYNLTCFATAGTREFAVFGTVLNLASLT